SDYIGEVKVRTGKLISIEVKGPHVQAFTVDNYHKISVKRSKLKTHASVFDIVLSVKTTEGVVNATFRIVKDNFIHNKVIAHRGAWKNTGTAENSIASLNHAIDLGCQGSEFDVHMS